MRHRPSVRSSRRNPRSHDAQRSHGSHGNHRNLGEQQRRLAARRRRVFLIEEMERGETDVGHFLFAKNEALIGEMLSDCGISAVGIVDADALPASERPSPAAPSAVTAAALVVRACVSACFTRGMVASFVSCCERVNLT